MLMADSQVKTEMTFWILFQNVISVLVGSILT